MNDTMRGPLAPGSRKAYALAGNSTFTILSTKTGSRFTYRVRAPEPDGRPPVYFVRVLTGPDNESAYTYVGMLLFNGSFKLGHRSTFSRTAPSVVAFDWVSRNWESDKVEVWHEGVCGRCGDKLTVPESIARGLGPICAGKVAA